MQIINHELSDNIITFLIIQVLYLNISFIVVNKLYSCLGEKSDFLGFWFETLKEFKTIPLKYGKHNDQIIGYAKTIRLITFATIISQFLLVLLSINI